MQKELKDLINLAYEIAEYAGELRVRNHEEIVPGVIKAYRATDSDHRTVTLLGNYPHQITVSLWLEPKIEGTMHALCMIPDMVANARAHFEKHKADRASRTEHEKQQDKRLLAEKLRKELEELEQ